MPRLDDEMKDKGTPAAGLSRPPAQLNMDIGALSHTGLVRENNEDAFAVFRIGRYVDRVDSNISEAELPSRFGGTRRAM